MAKLESEFQAKQKMFDDLRKKFDQEKKDHDAGIQQQKAAAAAAA